MDDDTENVLASVDIDGSVNALDTDHAFGDMGILLPAQTIPNFRITYSTDGVNDLVYVVNSVRSTWENGKKYTYKFAMTFNEITLDPSVTLYDESTGMPINL